MGMKLTNLGLGWYRTPAGQYVNLSHIGPDGRHYAALEALRVGADDWARRTFVLNPIKINYAKNPDLFNTEQIVEQSDTKLGKVGKGFIGLDGRYYATSEALKAANNMWLHRFAIQRIK